MLNGLARESEISAQRTFWRTRQEEKVGTLGPPAPWANPISMSSAGLMAGLNSLYAPDGSHDDIVDEDAIANPFEAAELAQLREAVDRLPGRERTLIRRHYFDHREFRLIAQELTVSLWARVAAACAGGSLGGGLRIRGFLEGRGGPGGWGGLFFSRGGMRMRTAPGDCGPDGASAGE